MIKDYLNEKTIQVNQKAKDYQEAIHKAALPLLLEGMITEEYIRQMIEAMEDLGPYMVLLPGIALAHARPSEHVKQECMSLMTLQTPVSFGHKRNDPVSIIFVLASPDKDAHMEVLGEISRLLMKEEFLQTLRQCNRQQEILSFFS